MSAAVDPSFPDLTSLQAPEDRAAALARWSARLEGDLSAQRARAFREAAALCRADAPELGAEVYAFAWGRAPDDLDSGRPDDYALLHAPRVRSWIEALLATRRIVFVTGCARSGTSLMQRCLATASDPVYYWSENALARVWRDRRIDGRHLVLKRRAGCHAFFHAIPQDVRIVHMVRDPAFVFTSRVPGGAQPYVTSERWRAEMAALARLRAAHPRGRLAIVRYEDLLAAPERVQERLAATLDLGCDLPFARYVERDHLDLKIDRRTGVKRRWEPIDPDRARRSRGTIRPAVPEAVLSGLRASISDFCAEHGYPTP